jgi:hypothetical protein
MLLVVRLSHSSRREHRQAELFARRESKPLVKRNGGDVVGEHVQERRGAFLTKLADKPSQARLAAG